jgi:hypothetical protein
MVVGSFEHIRSIHEMREWFSLDIKGVNKKAKC